MAGDDAVVVVDQDRVGPAEGPDGGGDLGHLLVGMGPGIAGIGDEVRHRPVLDGQMLACHAGCGLNSGVSRLFGGCFCRRGGVKVPEFRGFLASHVRGYPPPNFAFVVSEEQHRSRFEDLWIFDPPPPGGAVRQLRPVCACRPPVIAKLILSQTAE